MKTMYDAACLALLAGLSGPALAEIVAVPVGGRIEVFELDNAAAGRARAHRLDARPSDIRGGRIVALEGRQPMVFDGVWTLTGRVLVRAADIEAVRQAVGDASVQIAEAPGLAGWFTLDAGQVVRAAEVSARLLADPAIETVEMDAHAPVATRELPTDTYFNLQWHLHNTIFSGADARVVPVWDAGYTGQGVTICIVESNGFQLDHPDLIANVNTAISQPTSFVSAHMTAVAGVAGASRNGFGVVGAAYDAELSQALIGSAFQTAQAFAHRNDVNDIKNNSWGPLDNGTIDSMSSFVMSALVDAITDGRGGLGEIFVWAGGNGQGASDRVDYDPYASSRYTIAVGAIGDDEIRSDYSEPGSSLLVCAHSNGGSLDITTTTSNGGYTFSFGGTSAASPLAAGVVALMLQANPGLTWRDVQHILVDSARIVDPGGETWTLNGDNRLVSEEYGFGAVDALAAVTLAQNWVNVGPETSISSGVIPVNEPIPDGDAEGVERGVFIGESVRVESVELVVNAQSLYIGDLQISITSPEGTESLLAKQRFSDSQDNLVNTVFTSMRHWGERSEGTWTVNISDRRTGIPAVWDDFEIRIHGVWLGDGPCGPADLAEPFGLLDLADTNSFVVAFLTGDPSADLALPFGELNKDDITEFVFLFLQGCP